MSRPWFAVGIAVVVLAVGAWAAVRLVPPPVGMEPGRRLPEYRVVRAGTSRLRRHSARRTPDT